MKKLLRVIPFFTLALVLGFCSLNQSSEDANQLPALPKKWLHSSLRYLNQMPKNAQVLASDSNIVLLKNNHATLPFNDLMVSTTYLTLGGNSQPFLQSIDLFDSGEILTQFDALDVEKIKDIPSDRIVLSLHASHPDSLEIDPKCLTALQWLPRAKELILVVFGAFPKLSPEQILTFDAIVYAPENHPVMQDRTAQKMMGALPFTGVLPENIAGHTKGFGMLTKANGRLSHCSPEELGYSGEAFKKIDQIALNGIEAGAYPGCQIVVAVKGAVIYRKSFGKTVYGGEGEPITNTDLYDIASITKIASSTLMAMQLNYQGKLDLDETVGKYVPELTSKTEYNNIVLREMMTHQAGLVPFIPFYKRTVRAGKPSSTYYSKEKSGEFTVPVAKDLYLRQDYKDSMYAQIFSNPLKEKKYVYSDLCYYFMQPIFEKITGEKQDVYVRNHIYNLMGLRYINYLPLVRNPGVRVAPTEKESYFRNQMICGYVHDPGAAMLGGIGGHAGVFANATDLASIMQLFLNNGTYAGQTFFDEPTRSYFTKAQYPGNKRGIGFDRPNASGGGTCDELASQKSFGHSGFTGTLAWADPENEVVFIFLSNRVYPSQDNWKLRDMGIRTQIQHVVYEIVGKN
jgi:CubicO group peptidase (beta-lactamase class C family)